MNQDDLKALQHVFGAENIHVVDEKTQLPSLEDIFGPVIYSYTRAEAIADGTLIDLATFSFREGLSILDEAGIKYPTAITAGAYAAAVQELARDLPPGQDLSGRMWDLCFMLKMAARRSTGDTIQFKVNVVNWASASDSAKPILQVVTLKAVCGPGDNAEPVITIMLPDED